jgi:hypothetical protein
MTTWTKVTMMAVMALSTLQAATHDVSSKAEIPFAFQVAGRQMPAGKYLISRSATGAYTIQNRDTSRSALFQAPVRKSAKPGVAALAFRCAAEVCEVESVKFAGDEAAFSRVFPKLKRNATPPTTAFVKLTR